MLRTQGSFQHQLILAGHSAKLAEINATGMCGHSWCSASLHSSPV